MEKGPSVTIITVCLNSESTIRETLESVVNQTYANIEYLIMDGGSRDQTLDIVKEYQDHIRTLISEPDKGMYYAINRGLSLASGDIIGILNSDDYYTRDAVERVVEASLEHPEASVFFGNLNMLGKENDGSYEERKGSLEGLDTDMSVNHPTCFLRKEVYQRYSFRTDYRIVADYELMLRLRKEGTQFYHIDRPLAFFRYGGVSTVATKEYFLELYSLKREYGLITGPKFMRLKTGLAVKEPLKRLEHMIVEKVFHGDENHQVVVAYRKAWYLLARLWRRETGKIA